MSNPVGAQRYGLGGGDAYYDAVKYGGYTGTREQFGRDQAKFAQNATAVAEAREEVERNTQTVVNTAQTFTEETVPAAIQSVEEKGDTEEDRLELRTTELVEAVNTAGAVQVQAVTDEGTTQTGLVSDAGTAQVEAVEQAGSDQVDAVEAAGSTQVGNVNNAGTTQAENVNSAGTTQVGNVNTAGAAQVQAVEDKGEEVLNSIPADYSDLIEDVDNLKESITQIITEKVSVNKININSPLTEHYYLWQSGIKVSSGSSHYFISNPIAIKSGDVIRRNVTTAYGIQFGAYVNADNTPNSPATIYDKGDEYTVTRDGYISVNFPAGRLQNAMVTINTAMPDEFVPYHEDKTFLSNEIHLNTTQLEDAKKFVSVLNGKKIAYNGDSICESRTNTGTSNNGGAYAKLIADYTGGVYENRGLSGGILASAVGDGGSTPTRCVVSDVTNMANDADLICFEGGINDYWRNVPLGTYTESDYTGTLDTTTICGALESIFRQAIEKWAGKPIVFVITHKITGTVYTQNSAGYTWSDVHEKMVGICNKYAIPYYDAFSESGLNGYNNIQNTTFLTSNSTGNPDGCHPNESGYRRYYVSQLIALFESVMPVLESE